MTAISRLKMIAIVPRPVQISCKALGLYATEPLPKVLQARTVVPQDPLAGAWCTGCCDEERQARRHNARHPPLPSDLPNHLSYGIDLLVVGNSQYEDCANKRSSPLKHCARRFADFRIARIQRRGQSDKTRSTERSRASGIVRSEY